MIEKAVQTIDFKRYLALFALIFSGEIIFALPFHLARFFRPTFLEVFSLSNIDLGNIYAVYGIIAMLAYFPGGALADHISARKLLTISLVATSLGGLILAQIPSKSTLVLIYGYWGMTSIFLFWAAMLKATREWGNASTQGRAFGLLDGGRGLIAALIASFAVLLLSQLVPSGLEQANINEQTYAFKQVIYFYTGVTLISALLVWCTINDIAPTKKLKKHPSILNNLNFLKQPQVWLQASIVISAYCGYKGIDYYSLYAVDVLKLDPLNAASFTSLSAYLRPIAAISAGYLADRFSASKVIAVSFFVMTFSYFILSKNTPASLGIQLIYLNLIMTFTTVFAVRAIYFALLEENKVSSYQTGITIGFISVIGFTPDVFFAPIAGYMLDNAPGLMGYQHLFSLLSTCAAIGMITTLYLRYLLKNKAVTHTTTLSKDN